MIADSIPWKEELLRVAVRLERKKMQRRWSERSGFLVERDVMVSAYATRRLVEALKVSDLLTSRSHQVEQYPLIDRVPDYWSRDFWELYDLNAGTTVNLSLSRLCNQIIHSWMWSLSADEQSELLNGIYVSSDRSRSSVLYFIPIDMLIRVFRDVGREDIVNKQMIRGRDGQFRAVRIDGVLE